MALARALAIEPQVLLLDEPLSALDAKIRVILRQEIRAIQQELGITTVYVTHDQEEALSLSDRIVVMSEGRVEQIGTPFEIYNFPATSFVASHVRQRVWRLDTIVQWPPWFYRNDGADGYRPAVEQKDLRRLVATRKHKFWYRRAQCATRKALRGSDVSVAGVG